MYWPAERGLRGGGTKQLKYGYCLDTTIFASNKVGDKVYPPRAKTAELPNAMHDITIVRATEVKTQCSAFKEN
jgi:hypothetical protein